MQNSVNTWNYDENDINLLLSAIIFFASSAGFYLFIEKFSGEFQTKQFRLVFNEFLDIFYIFCLHFKFIVFFHIFRFFLLALFDMFSMNFRIFHILPHSLHFSQNLFKTNSKTMLLYRKVPSPSAIIVMFTQTDSYWKESTGKSH